MTEIANSGRRGRRRVDQRESQRLDTAATAPISRAIDLPHIHDDCQRRPYTLHAS